MTKKQSKLNQNDLYYETSKTTSNSIKYSLKYEKLKEENDLYLDEMLNEAYKIKNEHGLKKAFEFIDNDVKEFARIWMKRKLRGD